MALITETNAQYYEGEQYFESTGQVSLKVTLDTDLNDYGAGTPPQNANYTVAVNTLVSPTVFTDLALGTYSVNNNIVTIPAQAVGVDIRVKLKANALFNSYGGYEYVPLEEIINNFMADKPDTRWMRRGKVYPYLVANRCNQLIESVQEFI